MSNPTVSFSNTIPIPGSLTVTKKSYSKLVYNNAPFFTYKEQEFNYSTFEPANLGFGNRTLLFVSSGDSLSASGESQVNLIKPSVYDQFQHSPSGFFTENSIMPRLVIPTDVLVDNGSYDIEAWSAKLQSDAPSEDGKDLFNWRVQATSIYPSGVPADSYSDVVRPGFTKLGAKYLSVIAKDSTSTSNSTTLRLYEPDTPAPSGWWSSPYLVGQGAFSLMLNVTPIISSAAPAEDEKEIKWSVDIEISDTFRMKVQSGDMLKVYLGIEGEEQVTTVPLFEAKSAELPLQVEGFEKKPYVIVVYPVWNGVIVSNGVYSTISGNLTMNGTYCPKLKGASIHASYYMQNPFDPQNPDGVEIETGVGSKSVLVDFGGGSGDYYEVVANNCLIDIAYQPVFFWHHCWFDEWFIGSKSAGNVTYSYEAYPIWTKNGTTTGGDMQIVDYNKIVYTPDTEFLVIENKLDIGTSGAYKPSRWGPQVFGYILEITEVDLNTVYRDNGSFPVTTFWTGSTDSGDPSSTNDWTDYVTNVSVRVGLDGSDGTVTIDKYGVAGQSAVATQNIGALTVRATGGFGTRTGNIFSGLAMGIGVNETSDSSVWTIPLVGLEKKLEDIVLMNAPFFDGYYLKDVIEYLCKYGGILYNNTAYSTMVSDPPSWVLEASEDINSPRVDFRAGTPVLDALNQVMEMSQHTFVIRDGFIVFYELDETTSLPAFPNGSYQPTNWKPDYPNTKIQTFDMTPDFEDLRNEIIIFGNQLVKGSAGTQLIDLPLVPKILPGRQSTTPSIPWSRTLVQPLPGMNSNAVFASTLAKAKATSRSYELSGRVTIPGNGFVSPFDKWGDYFITSVSHNVDLQSKTWTTDLELATGE